jgi:formate hydrogenlyase transcriptional activator
LQAEPLLSLAVQIAGEHRGADVLNAIVCGLAEQPGVALARIWLLSPGDLCETCLHRSHCADRTQCLHLVASAGSPQFSPGEDWSFLHGRYCRIPRGHRKVGEIATTGRSILIPDAAATSEWIGQKEWAEREGIRGFVGYPLVARGEILGVLAAFSREPFNPQDFSWLGIFANQVAVAIANARAFEQIQHSESELRESETKHRSLVDLSPAAIFMLSSDGKFLSANPAGLRLLNCGVSELAQMSIRETYSEEDIARYPIPLELIAGGLFRFERTFVSRDGSHVPAEISLSPTFPGGRQAVVQDVSERKRTEKTLRQHAQELQQVIDVAPLHMFLWEADGSASYGNRASVEYFGNIPPKPPMVFLDVVTHPDDVGELKEGIRNAMARGETFEMETRMRRQDGEYRWFVYQICPLQDESGKITRWCGTRIDIDDRKRTEERTEKENLALREEIDKASMFEEIVGASPALQAVLARVFKVAKSDTTVLITGETGTGKELIARAIHKRSPRASRAFVSVNCAAIPRDLIASELFGHEKGAFTGALQRRLGRFELADGGTIFLDEIGELNPETQVALLRVLQEREFERVGGATPIRANVRVIAATHRDLPALIAAGTFRSDLYYRINVFPIEVPPLRKRREDIRLLVGYFIDRYASKAGKRIQSIDKRTMESLQSYPWPGNIRELQNVIERSVIVSDTEEFAIDESWLPRHPANAVALADDLQAQERERIEAALRHSKGRVSGPAGAAAALGLPASTLDSKIKGLKIDTRRYQTP